MKSDASFEALHFVDDRPKNGRQFRTAGSPLIYHQLAGQFEGSGCGSCYASKGVLDRLYRFCQNSEREQGSIV